ncbi:MAG TPA: hypothetical protein VNL18_05180 [Gemmatimonadales bacterium]|nr:hypothetical protein [Gemmatimonadales bacterium]
MHSPLQWSAATLKRGLNFTLAKRAAGRPRDPEVVAELEALRDGLGER